MSTKNKNKKPKQHNKSREPLYSTWWEELKVFLCKPRSKGLAWSAAHACISPTRWAQKRQKMLATSTVLQRFLNRTLKLFYRESNEHKEVSVTRKGTCQNCTYEIFARNFFGLRVQCYVREVRVGWPWEVRLPVQKWLCANLTPTRPRMRDGSSGNLVLCFIIFGLDFAAHLFETFSS